MKQIAILILICTLISGCRIFKKTTKDIEKHSEVTEQSNTKQTNIDYQDQSKSVEVNTSLSSEATVNGYKVTADAIKFNTDGSFDAKGNVSMTGNSEWRREKQDSAATIVNTDISLKENIVEEVSQKQEVKDYSKQTVSEPSGKGILYGAVGVLIVALGVCWWLGIGRG